MGTGRRVFGTFLCDACGREIIAEEGITVDGFYFEIMQVRGGEQVGNDNVYACSDICIDRAVHDALKRATMTDEERLTATQELWIRGRQFATNPALPVVDVQDETRVIGTAREITKYRPPSPEPRPDELDPEWKPEFKSRSSSSR